ncbi:EF-hand domain-containing protein 1 isoform X2 [Gasterosteus aculeatus]|uniref:DM10 domain-containing protein n=1 Tax=Gasterosteus aculeatus aculeatus TaxID=481459 RepID=A0AAQ4RA91_GASAC|nr:EF-hand domain-containing protein 1 isoform X2 [Gasterosteus aculeatus aculeatus]
MSWNHGLPFLPGYTFLDVTKSAFHRPQTLTYSRGCALPTRPTVGIGQDPLLSEQLIQQELSELSFETPDVTYGSFDRGLVQDFIPAHVALDKKVLRYYAYFQENILFSPEEESHVRPVVIYYYLEDDSMCIIEPVVENSGLPQGKRIKRQRLPKNERGEHYHWKDLNIGADLEAYGVTYHITQCDAFTEEFLESEGIVLNEPEPMPVDPRSERRKTPRPSFTTAAGADKMHQFLTMDRKVLRFFALWEDADPNGETTPVTIQYHLVDDTVEINEVYERNCGRFPFPALMHRLKLPKITEASGTFPSCVLEVSAAEVQEYYSPKDFRVGQPITLLGRRFLLYDCDGFTKEYYQKNHPDLEMKPFEVPKKKDPLRGRRKEAPPYNGFGSPEDSLQNCFSLIPTPPKKNVLKMLENEHKVLCYRARLDSPNPGDENRHFILSYFLSDDVISIFEKPTRGIIGGKFLKKMRIPKPGSTVDDPEFYSPADFAIGATVEVFGHRFVLTEADHNVLKYLESNASRIPLQTLDSLRQTLGVETANSQLTTMADDVAAEPSS